MKNNHVSMLHGVDRRQVLSILTGFGATGTQLLGTFTSQFFFDESVTDAVFAQSPYSSRRSRDTRNSNDGIYLGAGSRAITGRDDQEALVPWSAQTSASGTLLFDEATATTGFAFVNPLSLAGTVTIVAYRSDGTPIGSAAVTVGARSRVVGFLRSTSGLSGVAGTRGIATFTASNGVLCAVVLRFGPSGFESIPIVYT